MSKETILIVDDEEDIIELIAYNLKSEGYSIRTARTGEQAVTTARKFFPDLMVLDLMLPGIDGLEVTRCLKNDDRTKNIPIVMLTARGEESDIITGLELGASDYVLKPFSPKVLIARIRAILRRSREKKSVVPGSVILEGGLMIDRVRHEVILDGRIIDLTLSEFELLSLLAEKKGWVFTRGQIVDAIRGENYAVTERSVDVIIVGLRKKMKNKASAIETIRGVGYRFKE